METKRKGNLNRVTFILLLLGILILVNLISVNMFFRLDLTEGRIYTLAQASRTAVTELPDRLTVKAYFSKDLPAPYSSNARYLKDQLEEYRAHSNGNFHFEFVDPAEESELESEAQSFKIAPVQVQVLESDKMELRKVYMGLAFLYGDKRETIPLVQTTVGLEYDITSTIKKITSEKIPKVGFLTGHNETDPFQIMTALTSELQKNYEVSSVDLTGGNTVPDDLDALLVIRPASEFSDWDLFAIDQYIMKGGRIGWLVNKVEADLQQAQAKKLDELNIDEFTANYGFRFSSDLVYDQKCGMINIQQQQGFFTIRNAIPYPFFPVIRNFNHDNAMVKNLEELPLYFPSSIDLSISANDSGLSYESLPLAWTSNKSNKQFNRWEINPTAQGFNRMTFPDSAITVAATVIGSFESYFKDKPVPSVEGGEPFMDEPVYTSPSTRIVAIGDGNFVADTYLSSRTSADFFLNMVDWLAQDESLIHIRTREITSRPLADMSEAARRMVKYVNIFLPGLLVIIAGVIRWQMRKKFKPVL